MASYHSLSDTFLWQDIQELLTELEDDAFPSERDKRIMLILDQPRLIAC